MDLSNLTSSSDIISYGVVITIEGVLVVFTILILIMLVINAMSLFSAPKKQKKASVNVQENVIETTSPQALPESTSDNEEELIAVLTAAVAACMGTSSSSVNIKSYKKVSSAWGNAAKREVLNNRF